MSNTERAPEPTMEEILASIRRIISEDETNSAAPHGPAGYDAEFQADSEDDEADSKVIDDIARVLSGTPAEEDEDILDLTGPAEGASSATESSSTAFFSTSFRTEPLTGMTTADAHMPEAETGDEDIGGEASSQPSAVPFQFTETATPAELESAEDEAASALLKAFEALRGGDVPTAPPEPQAAFEPELVAEAVTERPVESVSNIAEALTAAEPDEFALEAEATPSEAEDESSLPEPESPGWSSKHEAWRQEPAAEFIPSRSHDFIPQEPKKNGSSHAPHYTQRPDTLASSGTPSFEDSVKEMLRPLLRQWLDEHMGRVLEAALRDELRESEAKRYRGNSH